jgi:5-methyltetrahydropteroyltriglutamate--homocysteine methyltransferase
LASTLPATYYRQDERGECDMGVTATIVGSYPKPPELLSGLSGRELLDSSGQGLQEIGDRLGQDELGKRLDQAVRRVISDQVEAGLDVVTDGEVRRGHYIYDVVGRLDGVDVDRWHEEPVIKIVDGERRQAYTMRKPTVTGKLGFRSPGLVRSFRYAQGLTDRPVKVGLPGPCTVVDALVDEHYGARERLAFDYADAIRDEVRALVDAGCRVIQFDDPGLLRDLPRSREWAISALDRCFVGIAVPTTIVHVCRSYPNRTLDELGLPYKSDQGYYPQLLELLQVSAIDQVSIEGRQGRLDPAVLSHLGDKSVLLGCVDVGDEAVEPVEAIVDQARAALDYVDADRLMLAPDCGLLQLSRDSARGKLANLARAAARLGTASRSR